MLQCLLGVSAAAQLITRAPRYLTVHDNKGRAQTLETMQPFSYALISSVLGDQLALNGRYKIFGFGDHVALSIVSTAMNVFTS